MYYLSIHSPLKNELKVIDFKIEMSAVDKKTGRYRLSALERVLWLLTKVVKFFYECFYFYMFPMLVIYIQKLMQGETSK